MKSTTSNRRFRTQGMLLVVMVGILTLLMILAVLFSTVARLEKARTSSDTGRIRAKLLARSGVEYALARLMADPAYPDSLTPSEDNWLYREDPLVPIEKAANPSYNADPFTDADGNGRYSSGDPYLDPDGNERYDGWSGRLRGTHGIYSDRFKLRIEDPAGRIAVNGDGTPGRGDEYVDKNGNNRWDPQETFTDRSVRVENGTGPEEWFAYGRGEKVLGEKKVPDEEWYPGEPYTDKNGNDRRDLLVYRDLNGDGIWQEDEPVWRGSDKSNEVNPLLESQENGEEFKFREGMDYNTSDSYVDSDTGFSVARQVKDKDDQSGALNRQYAEDYTEYFVGSELRYVDRTDGKDGASEQAREAERDAGMTDGVLDPDNYREDMPNEYSDEYKSGNTEDDEVDEAIDRADEDTGEGGVGVQTGDTYVPLTVYKEPYVETIVNGYYDPPEPYTDRNGNGRWDPAELLTLDWNQNGRYDNPLVDAGTGTRNLLDALGLILDLENGFSERVISQRLYSSYEELRTALGEEEYRKIRPYVTLYGRPDPSMVRPSPASLEVGIQVPYQAKLNRLDPLSYEARVLISGNAAPQEVLQSVFLPLEAKYLSRECGNIGLAHQIGEVREAEMRPGSAEFVSERMFQYREQGGTFRSHREWERFVHGLSEKNEYTQVKEETSGGEKKVIQTLQSEGVDEFEGVDVFLKELGIGKNERISELEAFLVLANTNPNSRLNKFNPDRYLIVPIDKSDLTAYTTELTFDPSGLFEMVSLGEVIAGSESRISASLEGVYALWEVWRDTTQADFSGGEVSWNSDPLLAPSHRNRTLQLYPEPEGGPSDWDGHIALATLRSEIIPQDGLEGGDPSNPVFLSGTLFAEGGIVDPDLMFYARYEDGLDADYSKYNGDLTCYPESSNWHPGWPDGPSGRPNGNSVTDAANPGSLYPDGVFSDFRNVPAYDMERHFQVHLDAPSQKLYEPDGEWWGKRLQEDDEGNAAWEGEDEGTVSLWFKSSAVDVSSAVDDVRGNSGFSQHRLFSFSYEANRQTSSSRYTWMFHAGWNENATGFHYEPDDDATIPGVDSEEALNDDEAVPMSEQAGGERIAGLQLLPERGEWHHLVAAWNQSRPDAPGSIQIWMNGIPGLFSEVERVYAAPVSVPFQRLFRLEDGVNRKRFRLGEIGHPGWDTGVTAMASDGSFPACSTIDEFCIYEKNKLRIEQADTDFASRQYQNGRYYGLDDASYHSAPQNLGTGVRVVRVSWTTRIPEENDQNHRVLVDVHDGREWLLDVNGDGKLSRDEEDRAVRNGWVDERGVALALQSHSGKVRYRAYFRHDESKSLSEPLLESPVLDDVTIAYVPGDGPVSLWHREQ